MKKILEKLLCNHVWKNHAKTTSNLLQGYRVEGTISTTEILICEKCGRIKKIVY